MQQQTRQRLGTTTFGLVLAAVGVGTFMPTTTQAQTRIIYGIVRDFQDSHPDFGMPGVFFGAHVAGNVGYVADAHGDPVFTGAGAVVSDQWRAVNGLPIAPHMYFDPVKAMRLLSPPSIGQNATIDSYDPGLGGYDRFNPQGDPIVLTDFDMPIVPNPGDLGASLGDVVFDGNGSQIISTSFMCDDFRIRNEFTVQISGDVTIGVMDDFELFNYAKLELLAGATLTLYVAGGFHLNEHAQFNMNTSDYDRVTIYILGSDTLRIEENSHLYATLVAPNNTLELRQTGDFYGRIAAAGLTLSQNAGFHAAGPFPAPCHTVLDTEGAWASPSNGAITGKDTFRQWFKTVPGVNADSHYGMTMEPDGTGALAFGMPDFTPIDDKLYGNQGDVHNRNFTYEVKARFVYRECGGMFFTFQGDGEVWAFVDDQLVIDLGGPQNGGGQHIDIDRLGLADGTEHTFTFFYAQRSNALHKFRVRTNLPLSVDPALTSTMAMYD